MATLTDPAGQVYTYAYDSGGRLASVTYPDATPGDPTDNPKRIFHYEDSNVPHALTGITDENGIRFATWAYDGQGRAVSSEHAGGANKVTISYNGTDSSTVTDYKDGPATPNISRTYTFQHILGVPKTTGIAQPCANCGGSAGAAMTHDANGNLASRLDWNGNRTCYAHDLTYNLETARAEGLSNTNCPAALASWLPAANTTQRKISTQWNTTLRVPLVVAEPLRKTTYVFNGGGVSCGFKANGTTLVSGVLCRKTVQATTDLTGGAGLYPPTSGTARVWNYTYNANGSVLTMSAPAVQTATGAVIPVTTYAYHANDATCPTGAAGADVTGCRGQVATVRNHLGHTTQITAYNGHGQPLTVIDSNGLTTTLAYDARQRLTSRSVGGETTQYSYDNVGQLIRVTLPDLSALEYQYDPAHRLTEIRLKNSSNGLIGKTTYALDLMGNRVAEQIKDAADAVLQARSRVYNNLNRLIQDIGGTNPAAQVTRYDYDNQGNLQSVTAPAGAGGTRSYTYDALNRLASQIDPNVSGNAASGSGITRYGYNGIDQLTQVTDPRNLTTSYTYDGLSNLKQQTSPDTGNTTNTHDVAGNILTSTDAKGQVTSYVYDALSRVTSMTHSPATGTQLKTVAYQYDNTGGGNFGVGRLTQVTETAADNSTLQITRYRYDQKGRLTEESRTLNGIAYVTGYGYHAAGRLTSISYPTGRTVNYTLDGVGRIAGITTTKGGATQTVLNNASYRPFGPIQNFTFGNGQTYSRSYDLDGRTTSYSQANQNIALTYDIASRITQLGANSYGYDEIDRLVNAATPAGTQAYSYDQVGNRTARSVGAATETYTFGTASNRLTQIIGSAGKTYAYDANGSVTGEGINSFTYDPRGRMTQSAGSFGASTYQVSSQGQRVRKSGAGGDTTFHYDVQGRLIAETSASGALQKEYIYLGDLPVAVIQ